MKKIIATLLALTGLTFADDMAMFERTQYNLLLTDGTYEVMYRNQTDDKVGTYDKILNFIQPGYNFGFGENNNWNTQYRYSNADGSKEERFRLTWKGYKFDDLMTIGGRYEYCWSDPAFGQLGSTEWGWFRLMFMSEYKLNDKVSFTNSFEPRFFVHGVGEHNGELFAYQNRIGFKIKVYDNIVVKPVLETFKFNDFMEKRDMTYTRIDLTYKF